MDIVASFNTEIYNQRLPAGVWSYIESFLYINDQPCGACEVWISVDGNYVMPTLTYPEGRFWFWFRARAGIYNIQLHAFKVRFKDREYIINSPTYRVVVVPSPIIGKPFGYEVKVFRKITLGNVINKLRAVKKFLYSQGYNKVTILGSLARQGYSYHDVDIYLEPFPKNKYYLQFMLRRMTLLPIDIRKPKYYDKVLEVYL